MRVDRYFAGAGFKMDCVGFFGQQGVHKLLEQETAFLHFRRTF